MLVRFRRTETGTYQIGEMAHLIARSLKGPRGDGELGESARDSYENHILVCPTCHENIDKNADDYPIETLRALKTQHEGWVAEALLTKLGIGRDFESSILISFVGWKLCFNSKTGHG